MITTMADKKKYVTVKDVPLIRVGTFDASTGESSITREDLDAMAEAAVSENLNLAVIKIGHTDPRFENPDWDGEPAYGQVTNLRVIDDRDGTLIGDLVNVPAELAEKMDSAYPYRSVEISWGVKLKDQKGKVVEEFPAVLTGLALLGRSEPAVSGLGTVHAELSKATTSTAKVSVFSAGAAMFALPGGLTTDGLRRVLQSALWQGDSDQFAMDSWMEDFDDTRVWYHRDGKLWQCDYTLAGTDVTWGTPVEVVEKRVFEPVNTSTNNSGDTITVPHAKSTKPESDPDSSTPSQSTTEEKTEMAFTDKQLGVLRKQYKLADDATEEDVLAAIDAEAEAAEAAEANKDGKDGENPPAPVTQLPPKPDRQPVAAAAPPAAVEPTESVKLSKAQFEQLVQSNTSLAAQLKTLTDKADKDRRDGIISAAFRSGRLHPTEVKAWREKMDENEEITASLLAARQPLFPVVEIGDDSAPFAMDTKKALDEATFAADDALFGIEGEK